MWPPVGLDAAEMGAIAAHVLRRARELRPRALLISSLPGALLLPRTLLRRTVVWADTTIAMSRFGLRMAWERRLEAQRVPHLRMLAVQNLAHVPDFAAAFGGRVATAGLPVPIAPGPPPLDPETRLAPARRYGLLYAGSPGKKGLDVAVRAWSRLGTDGRLKVTGIGEDEGRRFLAERGLEPPTTVDWLGRVSAAEHRRLSAGAAICLLASAREQYGNALLEGLADGALLVAVPADGPCEPLALARALDPSLVAARVDADALVAPLRRALTTAPAELADYARRAQELLTPYRREAFRATLRDVVAPALDSRS